MLVLERIVGQKLMIGSDIVITVKDSKSGCTLLDVEAKPEAVSLGKPWSENTATTGMKKWLCMVSRYERLKIADEITVIYIRAKGTDSVLLGVEAPRGVIVLREELIDPNRNKAVVSDRVPH